MYNKYKLKLWVLKIQNHEYSLYIFVTFDFILTADAFQVNQETEVLLIH